MALDMSHPRGEGYRWYLGPDDKPVVVVVQYFDYIDYDDSRWLDRQTYVSREDAEGAGTDTADLLGAHGQEHSRAHIRRNVQAVERMNNPSITVRTPTTEWFYTATIERGGLSRQVVGVYSARGETTRLQLYDAIKHEIAQQFAAFSGGELSNLVFHPNQL